MFTRLLAHGMREINLAPKKVRTALKKSSIMLIVNRLRGVEGSACNNNKLPKHERN